MFRSGRVDTDQGLVGGVARDTAAADDMYMDAEILNGREFTLELPRTVYDIDLLL